MPVMFESVCEKRFRKLWEVLKRRSACSFEVVERLYVDGVPNSIRWSATTIRCTCHDHCGIPEFHFIVSILGYSNRSRMLPVACQLLVKIKSC